jgi:hypothetical protein
MAYDFFYFNGLTYEVVGSGYSSSVSFEMTYKQPKHREFFLSSCSRISLGSCDFMCMCGHPSFAFGIPCHADSGCTHHVFRSRVFLTDHRIHQILVLLVLQYTIHRRRRLITFLTFISREWRNHHFHDHNQVKKNDLNVGNFPLKTLYCPVLYWCTNGVVTVENLER